MGGGCWLGGMCSCGVRVGNGGIIAGICIATFPVVCVVVVVGVRIVLISIINVASAGSKRERGKKGHNKCHGPIS